MAKHARTMATRTDALVSPTEASAAETVKLRRLDGAMAAKRGMTVRCANAALGRTNRVATRLRPMATRTRLCRRGATDRRREMAGGGLNRKNGEWNGLARGADGGYGETSRGDGLSDGCDCVAEECDSASAVPKGVADRLDGDADRRNGGAGRYNCGMGRSDGEASLREGVANDS